MGKWPMSPICRLVWHNLRFSWMQPLLKHSETRKKEKDQKWNKKRYKFSNLRMYLSCYVKPELSKKMLMYCTMPTCCCFAHCSGWSETETVTVGSSAHGRRGSRCVARTGGAMTPAVNCRGRAARTKHWHWHTVAGVEVRTELSYTRCMLRKSSWIHLKPFLQWGLSHGAFTETQISDSSGTFWMQETIAFTLNVHDVHVCTFFVVFPHNLVSSWHWKSYTLAFPWIHQHGFSK